MKFTDIVNEVSGELGRARTKFPPFASAFEGYSIILEELDELWVEIKKKPADRDELALRTEATQVAAMAMRFLLDVC